MLGLAEEKNIFGRGCRLLGAIDEAGRGPLAGPVVAACVICGPEFEISDELAAVNDSKILSAKRREALYRGILDSFEEVGVGICEHDTIDRINILEAAFLAMKKALGALKRKPDFIVLDGGFPIPNISTAQKAIVRGDGTVFSIAAASIVAKVTRDRIMGEMHEKYPEYGFDRHKGYGTKLHLERLREYGPCPIHRRSFAPVRKPKDSKIRQLDD